MMSFVRKYLGGELERLDWDLDFNHYLIENYPKMERENCDLAECFNFYLAEEGFDRAEGLPDKEHKAFIRKQFKKLEEVIRDGFW